MTAPRKSKTIDNDRELDRAIQADFEHDYYEDRLDEVPPICEGLGYEIE
jgi:hypothetical protein